MHIAIRHGEYCNVLSCLSIILLPTFWDNGEVQSVR
jgi:hypothetical protein